MTLPYADKSASPEFPQGAVRASLVRDGGIRTVALAAVDSLAEVGAPDVLVVKRVLRAHYTTPLDVVARAYDVVAIEITHKLNN